MGIGVWCSGFRLQGLGFGSHVKGGLITRILHCVEFSEALIGFIML